MRGATFKMRRASAPALPSVQSILPQSPRRSLTLQGTSKGSLDRDLVKNIVSEVLHSALADLRSDTLSLGTRIDSVLQLLIGIDCRLSAEGAIAASAPPTANYLDCSETESSDSPSIYAEVKIPTVKSLNMWDLDFLHTDALLQSQGFAQKKPNNFGSNGSGGDSALAQGPLFDDFMLGPRITPDHRSAAGSTQASKSKKKAGDSAKPRRHSKDKEKDKDGGMSPRQGMSRQSSPPEPPMKRQTSPPDPPKSAPRELKPLNINTFDAKPSPFDITLWNGQTATVTPKFGNTDALPLNEVFRECAGADSSRKVMSVTPVGEALALAQATQDKAQIESSLNNQLPSPHNSDHGSGEDDTPWRMQRAPTKMSADGMANMDALRVQQEHMLVESSTSERERCPPGFLAPIAEPSESGTGAFSEMLLVLPQWPMWAYGLIPYGKGTVHLLYSYFAFFAVAVWLGHSLVLAGRRPEQLSVHLATACYGLGGLVGAACLRIRHLQNLLGPHNKPLELYAAKYGFLEKWRAVSFYRFLVVLALWACIIFTRIWSTFACKDDNSQKMTDSVPQLVGFLLLSGLPATLTYCQLHICCGLELAIDQYCLRFFDQGDLCHGIAEWNILQAILRRAAHTIDSCFLALNTSVLATLLLTGVELLQGNSLQYSSLSGSGGRCFALWFAWVLPPVYMVIYSVFRAAAVTEKCSRVPALVNSWDFSDPFFNLNRQYVVQYITHSAGGFYVNGVRLNAFMALKLGYLFGAIVFTLATQTILRQ